MNGQYDMRGVLSIDKLYKFLGALTINEGVLRGTRNNTTMENLLGLAEQTQLSFLDYRQGGDSYLHVLERDCGVPDLVYRGPSFVVPQTDAIRLYLDLHNNPHLQRALELQLIGSLDLTLDPLD